MNVITYNHKCYQLKSVFKAKENNSVYSVLLTLGRIYNKRNTPLSALMMFIIILINHKCNKSNHRPTCNNTAQFLDSKFRVFILKCKSWYFGIFLIIHPWKDQNEIGFEAGFFRRKYVIIQFKQKTKNFKRKNSEWVKCEIKKEFTFQSHILYWYSPWKLMTQNIPNNEHNYCHHR